MFFCDIVEEMDGGKNNIGNPPPRKATADNSQERIKIVWLSLTIVVLVLIAGSGIFFKNKVDGWLLVKKCEGAG